LVTSAAAVRFAADHKIKRTHIFMCTQPDCVAVLAVLAQEAGLEFLSYDSSTFVASGALRVLVVPTSDGLSYTSTKERFLATKGQDRRARDFMLQDCPCASCVLWRQDVQRDGDYWLGETRLSYRFLAHNYVVQKQTFDRIHAAAVADPDYLLRTVTGKAWGKVRRAFSGRGEPIATEYGSHRSLMDYCQ
jgi:hypothetical protein